MTHERWDGHGEASLAVDGGQSAAKVRHRAADGSTREIELAGVRTDLPLLPQLLEIVEVSRRTLGGFSVATFGVSGLTSREHRPEVILDAGARHGLQRVGLAHDSVTAYLSALGKASGVVIAAGTGVVAFAVGASDSARVDGWGNILGDAGSGYWLGRHVLDAVMRAHDGRGPETSLTDRVREEFPDLETAYIDLQNDPDRVRRVAAYARVAAEHADGDDVARGIVERAAAELAHSTSSAWRRVGEGMPRVCALGGLFRSELLSAAFAERIHASHPGAPIEFGHANALDGVEALAGIDVDGPLASHVRWAIDAEGAGARDARLHL